ncbi:hypothetical protein RS84_02728 [Microbacterium hydrocarbonoxydans]|uniref:Uncharacterized protein n=1 Tax=Microbacterium hydrocarbonoxydans TaxID=273678 RepID=A0A0M2HH84_9MICO|nr:hypothetical protein [Microbacterium hydrocarbonoxydans]KJL46105.1 hypothetical protein RS84_02728 [Microbacterium hydrocarbonoxydans]
MPAHALSEPTPVFVDPRGRRRRWAVIAAWIGSAVAATYLALVVSALLGGPTINAPFFPTSIGESVALPRPLPSPVTPPSESPAPIATEESDPVVTTTTATTSETAAAPPADVSEPAATAPASDAPGNSESAPGQTVSATSPGADNRAAVPDPHSTGRPQP